MITRRHLLRSAVASAAAWAIPGHTRTPSAAKPQVQRGLTTLTGPRFDLTIARQDLILENRHSHAITLNGCLPAPVLRWREGDTVTLAVTNRLDEPTSIHWHGILLPNAMDGVPGLTFAGIDPGETFIYTIPVRQSGTYWYHSHSGLQQQGGHYGPLVIDPAGPDPVACDREYVLFLSDWTFMAPERLFAMLKKDAHSLNFQKRTVLDNFAAIRREGLGAVLADRWRWGMMRMMASDIADVGGATYRYLINGRLSQENETFLFAPGERIRLRIINGSAMSMFNVRIPGLPMTVVQADGVNIQPIETDELQIATAETYDVIVQPQQDQAHTVMAESIERLGYARATLAPRPGMQAAIPPLRSKPILTMKDMGMAHGGAMTASHAGHGHREKMDGMGDMDTMEHNTHQPMQHHDHARGVGVDNVAMQPSSRLDEPGIGLEHEHHRVLRYSELRSLVPHAAKGPPERHLEIHLTGNMERYMWSFDGKRFSEVKDPILFRQGERIHLVLVNDTMMGHPIHLHGMFMELVNGHGSHQPHKHTVLVKPGERLALEIDADAPGDWAFHCHLLYHMHAGMFQVVRVQGDRA